MRHVVGVDIGGTKTHIMLAAADPTAGSGVQQVTVASSSWRGQLGDPIADGVALHRLLLDRLGAELVVSALAVGAHGCENTKQCREFARSLRAQLGAPVLVVNDSELMPPAMGYRSAIGVAVGTGSIATARDGRGELVTSGGWGWILGDDGSAPGLVREAARAVLTQLDQGGEVDPLGRRLMDSFAVCSGDELALAVTEAGSAESVGRHASAVFAAAEDGSALAEEVIVGAGEQLALLVERLRGRGIGGDAVVAGGTVIERQPRLERAFRESLGRRHPQLELRILDRAPAEGAIALARRILTEPGHETARLEY